MKDVSPNDLYAITIDTNVINSWNKIDAMNVLERWRDEGRHMFLAPSRQLGEVHRHRHQPAADQKAAAMNFISEPAFAGISFFDDAYLAPPEGPSFIELAALMFPNSDPQRLRDRDTNDIMNLLAHHRAQGHFFVTNDRHFVAEEVRGARTNWLTSCDGSMAGPDRLLD
jgi:hypothetical protein